MRGRYLTKPERVLKKAMKEAGIDAIEQYPVPSKLILDFKIRGLLIDIEVDGEHWHRGKRLIKDRRRDYALKKLGYKVIRFPSKQVENNTQECINEIREVIRDAGTEN